MAELRAGGELLFPGRPLPSSPFLGGELQQQKPSPPFPPLPDRRIMGSLREGRDHDARNSSPAFFMKRSAFSPAFMARASMRRISAGVMIFSLSFTDVPL